LSEGLPQKLKQAILDYDEDLAKKIAKDIVATGLDVNAAIEKATEGIREVGDRFSCGEAFLPHLILAGDAMSEALRILEANLSMQERESKRQVKIVLGTVKDDIHDLGKNIVGAMLKAERFEIHDIGKNAPVESFLQKANEIGADIVAVSALMTITINGQKELIEEVNRLGLKNKFKVIIGGGATSKDWAKEIGADGYGRDAIEAVKVVKQLLSIS
jgi:trimethylamine corrinoid protein